MYSDGRSQAVANGQKLPRPSIIGWNTRSYRCLTSASCNPDTGIRTAQGNRLGSPCSN